MTDYDFRGLSPIDFEALVRDLLQSETGLPFETFAVGPDGGIDCRHTSPSQSVVAQCKHRPNGSKSQIVAAAKVEATKLREKPPPTPLRTPNGYYFVTSADLSPDAVSEVAAALGPLVESTDQVWTRGRLNGLIASSSDIERRHFKLWLNSAEVFDRIVGSGEWERNEALIQDIEDAISVYVRTPKFDEALNVLTRQRVALISGAPGVGKSTLAEMLLLTHWQSGWKVIDLVSDVAGAWRHVRDHPDQRVIFFYDDFLGQSSSLELQKNEGNDLNRLIRSLQRSKSGNALLVMTTREQILRTALSGSDERVQRALEGQERIRIELDEISRGSRALMLFNHLYFAYQGSDLLPQLSDDTRYRKIIDHPGFNPRVLRSVVLLKRPPSVDALYTALEDALNHPDAIWSGSFQQLSPLAVRIVLNLAIEPRRSVAAHDLEHLAIGLDPRAYVQALKVLEGTWIRIEASTNGPEVRLQDPSRRDFLLDLLDSGPMFNQALDDASGIEQVDHLLKYGARPAVQARIESSIARIDDRATDAFGASIRQARTAERERLTSRFSSESFRERMASLLAGAAVVRRQPGLVKLRESLATELAFLDTAFVWPRHPTSSNLFALAVELDGSDISWGPPRAEHCVKVGVSLIEETQQLREFADLPMDLRARVHSEVLASALREAFDAELDGISQQSERDVMEQWLDEIEQIAFDLGEPLSTNSLREDIDAMPLQTKRARASREAPLPVETRSDDADAALAELFARLRSDH